MLEISIGSQLRKRGSCGFCSDIVKPRWCDWRGLSPEKSSAVMLFLFWIPPVFSSKSLCHEMWRYSIMFLWMWGEAYVPVWSIMSQNRIQSCSDALCQFFCRDRFVQRVGGCEAARSVSATQETAEQKEVRLVTEAGGNVLLYAPGTSFRLLGTWGDIRWYKADMICPWWKIWCYCMLMLRHVATRMTCWPWKVF